MYQKNWFRRQNFGFQTSKKVKKWCWRDGRCLLRRRWRWASRPTCRSTGPDPTDDAVRPDRKDGPSILLLLLRRKDSSAPPSVRSRASRGRRRAWAGRWAWWGSWCRPLRAWWEAGSWSGRWCPDRGRDCGDCPPERWGLPAAGGGGPPGRGLRWCWWWGRDCAVRNSSRWVLASMEACWKRSLKALEIH